MAIRGEQEFADLCSLMHRAAIGAGSWLDYLQGAKAAVGVDVTSIEMFDKGTGEARTMVIELLDDAATREYEERIIFVNPRISPSNYIEQHPGNIHANRHLSVRNDEFDDWVERHEICPWFAGGVATDNASHFAISAMMNHRRSGAPDAEAERVWAKLLLHLNNALAVEAALARRGEQAAIFEAAGADERAYALLDGGGRVTQATAAFVDALENNPHVDLRRGELTGSAGHMRQRLGALVRSVLAPGAAAPALVRIAAPEHGQGLLLRAIPLDRGCGFFSSLRPVALLVLIDLDAPARAQADELREIWGLSPREAELATMIVGGRTLAEAARRLGVSEGTARQHLKSVFRRMDITRQVDLVRLAGKLGG